MSDSKRRGSSPSPSRDSKHRKMGDNGSRRSRHSRSNSYDRRGGGRSDDHRSSRRDDRDDRVRNGGGGRRDRDDRGSRSSRNDRDDRRDRRGGSRDRRDDRRDRGDTKDREGSRSPGRRERYDRDAKRDVKFDASVEKREQEKNEKKEAEIELDEGDDWDFMDPEEKEAEEARLAKERRMRLKMIKEKHAEKEPSPPPSSVIAPTATEKQKEEVEGGEEVAPPEAESAANVPQDASNTAAAPVASGMDMFNLDAASPTHRLDGTGNGAFHTGLGGTDDQSNWDDADGYYRERIGEVIADRYRVCGTVGRGVFSTVLKCVDTAEGGRQVAIKMVRNNDTMRRAAAKELELLREICGPDSESETDKANKFCVQLLGHMEHRNHTALIFESLHMNLRDTQKKFGGKNVGINIKGVQRYAQQMLLALRHLKSLDIVHADLKPDNMLVNDNFTILKLCDFGSAFKENSPDNDITPYLVSRFYRAPEIELALPYTCAIDVWAVGCCLFELFTGRVLFPGKDNNHMLRLQQEYKGAFPVKMLKRSRANYETLNLPAHFEEDNKFRQHEIDPVTGTDVLRYVVFTKPTSDIRSELLACRDKEDSRSTVLLLADILEQMLTLDPAQRPTPTQLLRHALFKEGKK